MTVTVREIEPSELIGLISTSLDANVSDDWKRVLTTSARNSTVLWIGTDGDRVLCFYGLIAPTMLSDEAYLWMHTTEALKEHTFVLIRHSQRAIRKMLELFPIIVGHGQIGADRSLAWLRMIGAEFGPPDRDRGLIPFEIRSK